MEMVYIIEPEFPEIGSSISDIEFKTNEDAVKYCHENSIAYYHIVRVIPHRDLFFKDVLARIPYGVKFRMETGDDEYKTITFKEKDGSLLTCGMIDFLWMERGSILPYLRPMSSMTEEERKFYNAIVRLVQDGEVYEYEVVDWLLEHHFDYRGLIGKGLAIEVTEENNPYIE